MRASQSGSERPVLEPETVYTDTPFCWVTLRDMAEGVDVDVGGQARCLKILVLRWVKRYFVR